MKKQKKQLLALVLVLAVLLLTAAGISFYSKQREEKEQKEESASVEVYRAEASDIDEIICENGGEEGLYLAKQEETWISPETPQTELDQEAVETLVSQLANISADRVLENADAKEYGFTDPLGKVKVIADGQETVFTIGMKNEMTGEYYLIKNDDTSRVFVTDDELYLLTQKTTENYQAAAEEE